MKELDQTKLWYQTNLDIFLNRWFADYDEARRSRETHGGFLLPYRHHFYVCQPDVINALGLDPNDADWEKIGYDCARPDDPEAFQRLKKRREKLIRDADESD